MKTVPRSKTAPAIQLLQWILDPVSYLNTNFQRYGDIFYATVSPFDSQSLVLVNHPQLLQYILTHDTGKKLSAPGEANVLLESLFGKNSVALLSGQRHRRHRKLMMPPFYGDRLKAYANLICQLTYEVMDQWPVNQPFDVQIAMQQITLKMMLKAVFGIYAGERYQRLEQLLAARLDMISSPLTAALLFFPILQKVDLGPWSPGGRVRSIVEATDELILAEIQERRANLDPNRTDVLSLLLVAQDEDGNGLTDQELRDELTTLLIGGYETASTSLTWALYWTHYLPEVRQKLQLELSSLGESPDPMTLYQLPYLTAVCNETLRIYSAGVLTMPRRVEVPLEVMGYSLEPGMMLIGCIYLLHHREDLYPEPDRFYPERFLEQQFSAYEFMPFGGGARRCIGSGLALYELRLVLGTILIHWDLELVNKQPIKPKRRAGGIGPGVPVKLRKTNLRSR
jgi:cytochrome P450